MVNMRKHPGLVLLAVAVCAAMLLAGCSDGDDDSGSSASTVTRYAYRLNYNDSYHRVTKFIALDNGSNSFEVEAASLHYFAISTYQNRTGNELCDIVRTNAVAPNSSSDSTIANDTAQNVNTSTGTDVFHLRKGLRYTVYYYF